MELLSELVHVYYFTFFHNMISFDSLIPHVCFICLGVWKKVPIV